MATIKERAHQYGCKIAGGHYLGGLRGIMYESNRDAYIEIATEQREIDIEKACDWLHDHLYKDKPDLVYRTNIWENNDHLIRDFREAMEGLCSYRKFNLKYKKK